MKPVLATMRSRACEDAKPNTQIEDGNKNDEYYAALHANNVQKRVRVLILGPWIRGVWKDTCESETGDADRL